MNKKFWTGPFSSANVPAFPCPRCGNGHLQLKEEDDLKTRQPGYVTLESWEEDPERTPERFTTFLECTDPSCREVVAVAGNVVQREVETDLGWEFVPFLRPSGMVPAPPLIEVPADTPRAVQGELKKSFELFWNDYGVCASRLRTSVERLLDHFGVAKTRIARARDGRGRRVRLDLSQRIDKLRRKIGTYECGDILHALRVIGNLGTHGGNVSNQDILDAYGLYEIALRELFAGKEEKASAIIKRLKARKEQ